LVKLDQIPSSSRCNKIVAVDLSKRNHNPNKAWQELP